MLFKKRQSVKALFLSIVVMAAVLSFFAVGVPEGGCGGAFEIEGQALGRRDHQRSQEQTQLKGEWFVRLKDESLVRTFAQFKNSSRQSRTRQLSLKRKDLVTRLDALEQKLQQNNPEVQVVSKHFTAVTGIFLSNNLSDEEMQSLKQTDPNILDIQFYEPTFPLLNDAHGITTTSHIHEHPEIFIDEAGQHLTGVGVKVAVIDSGIDPFHPDLGGAAFPNSRIKGGYNAQQNNDDITDFCGHGTHVASIIGGDGTWSDGNLRGVASEVDLYIYKAMHKYGNDCAGSASAFLTAIELAVDPNGDSSFDDMADVINISMGIGPEHHPDSNVVAVAAQNIIENTDVIIVASAGNSGGGYTQCDDSGSGSEICCPACAESVITVGATTKNDDYWFYSSYGPSWPTVGGDGSLYEPGIVFSKPDISAPGVNICAARIIGGTDSDSNPSGGENTEYGYSDEYNCWNGENISTYYVNLTGTSMASPYIAGVIALLKQSYPSANRNQIKQFLQESASKSGKDASSWTEADEYQFGAGRVATTNALLVGGGYDDIDPSIFGCTDLLAKNYVPDALFDDGSCEYFDFDDNSTIADWSAVLNIETEFCYGDENNIRAIYDPDYLVYEEGEEVKFKLGNYYGPNAKYSNKTILIHFLTPW
jgi:subtilisin family serine protease